MSSRLAGCGSHKLASTIGTSAGNRPAHLCKPGPVTQAFACRAASHSATGRIASSDDACQPSAERRNDCTYTLSCWASATTSTRATDVGSLQGKGGEGVHGEQIAAGGVGERLGGYDADAQAGVAAGTAADDHRMHVARLPLLLGQKSRQGRNQIARMPAGFFQKAHAAQLVAQRQRDLGRAARCLQD